MSYTAKNERRFNSIGKTHTGTGWKPTYVHLSEGVQWSWSEVGGGTLYRQSTDESWPAPDLDTAAELIDRMEAEKP
jgi:hypothetical protein